MLYIAPAVARLRSFSVGDPDIWWHLRTGEWISLHHAVPYVDLFSSATMGKPWEAYSWLYAIVVYHLFHRLGFAGIAIYSIGMVLAITVALHHLVNRLQSDFTIAILLTATACLTMGRLYSPRPWLVTILFFIIELDILLQARKTGRVRELLWLPLLFALWANIHIQFIDGLVVLALALAESVLSIYVPRISMRILALPLAFSFLACLLATLLTPYGWHIYKTAHDLATQHAVLNFINELQALPFRSLSDYAVLFLAFASVAMLARSPRLLAFETALFLFAAIVSFRSARDLWVMTITASAILASTLPGRQTPRRLPAFFSLLAASVAAIMLLLAARLFHINNATLNTRLESQLPVRAVDFAKAHHYPGPVYNNYDWGGFLIWELRFPVSIDGRAALHGDDRIHRSEDTWEGQPDWDTDPQLHTAGLVVAPVSAPLTQLLRTDPEFHLAYEDKLTALFVPTKPRQTPPITPQAH